MLTQPSVEHNKHKVLPVPVGDSKADKLHIMSLSLFFYYLEFESLFPYISIDLDMVHMENILQYFGSLIYAAVLVFVH